MSVVKYAVLAVAIGAILLPLLYVISIGFRHHDDVYEIWPIHGLTLENIPEAIHETIKFANITFIRTMANSLLVSASSIVGIIVIAVLAAYAFSSYKFRLKESVFITFLISFMIPVQVLLIPLFVLMKNLGLLKSYLVLILPYITVNFPVAVLILRGFFEKIPGEIKDAALVGAVDAVLTFDEFHQMLSEAAIDLVQTTTGYS